MNTSNRIIEILESRFAGHYTHALNANPGMVLIKDNEDKIVWANRVALDVTGLENKNRLIGKSPSDLLEFIPKNKYALIDKEVISSREARLNMIEVVNTPTRKDQVFRIDKIPFVDTITDECIGVITYLINISDTIIENIQLYVSDVEYQELRMATKCIISKIRSSSKEPIRRKD